MDRQSEWITLRHMHAFLKSRNLTATARTLEQEARLKFDYPYVRALLSAGRWRSADEYISSFLLGSDDPHPPKAAGTLFIARFQRLVRALKQGDTAWARRFYDHSVEPLLANHPREAEMRADCLQALSSSPRKLHRDHPDDKENRRLCVTYFTALVRFNKEQLKRCTKTFICDKFKRPKSTRIIGLRRLRVCPRSKKIYRRRTGSATL